VLELTKPPNMFPHTPFQHTPMFSKSVIAAVQCQLPRTIHTSCTMRRACVDIISDHVKQRESVLLFRHAQWRNGIAGISVKHTTGLVTRLLWGSLLRSPRTTRATAAGRASNVVACLTSCTLSCIRARRYQKHAGMRWGQ